MSHTPLVSFPDGHLPEHPVHLPSRVPFLCDLHVHYGGLGGGPRAVEVLKDNVSKFVEAAAKKKQVLHLFNKLKEKLSQDDVQSDLTTLTEGDVEILWSNPRAQRYSCEGEEDEAPVGEEEKTTAINAMSVNLQTLLLLVNDGNDGLLRTWYEAVADDYLDEGVRYVELSVFEDFFYRERHLAARNALKGWIEYAAGKGLCVRLLVSIGRGSFAKVNGSTPERNDQWFKGQVQSLLWALNDNAPYSDPIKDGSTHEYDPELIEFVVGCDVSGSEWDKRSESTSWNCPIPITWVLSIMKNFRVNGLRVHLGEIYDKENESARLVGLLGWLSLLYIRRERPGVILRVGHGLQALDVLGWWKDHRGDAYPDLKKHLEDIDSLLTPVDRATDTKKLIAFDLSFKSNQWTEAPGRLRKLIGDLFRRGRISSFNSDMGAALSQGHSGVVTGDIIRMASLTGLPESFWRSGCQNQLALSFSQDIYREQLEKGTQPSFCGLCSLPPEGAITDKGYHLLHERTFQTSQESLYPGTSLSPIERRAVQVAVLYQIPPGVKVTLPAPNPPSNGNSQPDPRPRNVYTVSSSFCRGCKEISPSNNIIKGSLTIEIRPSSGQSIGPGSFSILSQPKSGPLSISGPRNRFSSSTAYHPFREFMSPGDVCWWYQPWFRCTEDTCREYLVMADSQPRARFLQGTADSWSGSVAVCPCWRIQREEGMLRVYAEFQGSAQ